MAAQDKMNNNGHVCSGCSCGRHWTFFLLRVLLTILILMFVFWFGLAVGRMSSGYARDRMMTGYGYPITGYNPGGPMIPVNGTATSSATMPSM